MSGTRARSRAGTETPSAVGRLSLWAAAQRSLAPRQRPRALRLRPGAAREAQGRSRHREAGGLACVLITLIVGWFHGCANILHTWCMLHTRSFYIAYFSVSEVAQSCPTLFDPMDCSLPGSSVHGIFPGKNTGVGCHFLLQGIFLTQGLNPGLPLQCSRCFTV